MARAGRAFLVRRRATGAPATAAGVPAGRADDPPERPRGGGRAAPGAAGDPVEPERRAVAAGAAALVAGAVLLVAIGMTAAGDGGSSGAKGGAGNGSASGSRRTPPAGPAATPTAPLLPPNAVPATREGTIAFVTYWFDALNYAVSTGNTAALQAVSSPTCQPCATAIAFVQASYQGGGSLRGGTYSLRNVTTDSFFNLDKPTVVAIFDRSHRSKLGPGGQMIEVLSPGTFVACQILLERVDDRWRVLDVQCNSPII